MAKETSKTTEAATTEKAAAEVKKAEPKAAQESLYSVSELAASAKKVFETRRECVEAALKEAGKTSYTVSEAKEIVEKFLKKEVK